MLLASVQVVIDLALLCLMVCKPPERKGQGNGFLVSYGMEYTYRSQLVETYHDHLVQLPNHFRADRKLKHIISKVFWGEAWARTVHAV